TFLAEGFDPYSPQFTSTSSPRHANVLLIGFPISEKLNKAAAVIFAQTPRPRMLVFVGGEEASPLPKPNLIIEWDKVNHLPSLLKNRKLINDDFEAFEPTFFEEVLKDGDENSHEHDHHSHEGHKNKHEDSEKEKENEGESEENNHHSENHEEHDGGGMDFMSMVEMTKGKPKSKDGLI